MIHAQRFVCVLVVVVGAATAAGGIRGAANEEHHQTHYANSPPNTTLGRPFLGFYLMENATDLRGWGNAWFSDSPEALVQSKRENGYDRQLMMLEYLCLNHTAHGVRLLNNWREQWHQVLAPIAAPLLANGTIVGFFLGDELMWNGFPYSQLDEWSKEIRKTFPTAFLWENEAWPTYSCAVDAAPECNTTVYKCCSAYGDPIPEVNTKGIPEALNVTSIDKYLWSNNTEGWKLVDKTIRPFYETHLYPRAHPGQGFFQVPGSAASTHNPGCDLDCYEQLVIHDLNRFLDWMKNDTNIWGMMPWIWKNCGKPCIAEIGTADMPWASKHWREVIGPAVLNL